LIQNPRGGQTEQIVEKPLTKHELRRLARQERKAQEALRLQRARRQRLSFIAVGVVVVLGVAVWLGRGALQSRSATAGLGSTALPIVDYAIQGRDHIQIAQPHPAYNSNPPTSGWHYPAPADWGFYNEELPDELLVHNLEHGGIWISFRSAEDTELINQLVALLRGYRSKVIITQRSRNDTPLAVAAWGHLMKLDHYDNTAIVTFINRFKNQGPELFPD
jgi:hypothetical protein